MSPRSQLTRTRPESAMVRCSSAAQRILGEDSTQMTAKERVSVVMLIAARASVILDAEGHFDMSCEKGVEACHRFLDAVEQAAEALDLQPESRVFRGALTNENAEDSHSEARNYQVDLLEASMRISQNPVIWANGEAHELSEESVDLACALRRSWVLLCSTLLPGDPEARPREWLPPLRRSHLCNVLADFDVAWVAFERAYIEEIMTIQKKARGVVAQAIEYEHALSNLERTLSKEVLPETPAYQANIRLLVACIERLNSIANVHQESRTGFNVSILDSAFGLLQLCEVNKSDLLSPARAIAMQVVESFEDLRDYLQEVAHHLDELHPQLCQNQGLVDRLVRWEQTWEVGARYIQCPQVLGSICNLVPELRTAQEIIPAFATMCEDCDAELFLVLPRIVWLCFLADAERSIELIRRLLPHRFVAGPILEERRCPEPSPEGASSRGLRRVHSAPALTSVAEMACDDSAPTVDSDLQRLLQKFWRAEATLTQASSGSNAMPKSESFATMWEVLIGRAVVGAGNSKNLYEALAPARRDEAQAVVEDLMHELERWSMELQRHSPEDWNECINVLVQCLPRGSLEQEQQRQPRRNDSMFVL